MSRCFDTDGIIFTMVPGSILEPVLYRRTTGTAVNHGHELTLTTTTYVEWTTYVYTHIQVYVHRGLGVRSYPVPVYLWYELLVPAQLTAYLVPGTW